MADDFLGGDFPPSKKFEKPGDWIDGIIESCEKQDDTDPNGNVKKWPNGATMHVYPTIIDSNTEGRKVVWLRSYLLKETKAAANEANIKQMVGSYIHITFIGYGESKTKGFAPPKLFKVVMKPAAPTSISVDDLLAS